MIGEIYFNYGNLVLILLFRANWKKVRKKEKKKMQFFPPPIAFLRKKNCDAFEIWKKKKFYNQHCNLKLRINKNEKKKVNEKKKNNKTLNWLLYHSTLFKKNGIP